MHIYCNLFFKSLDDALVDLKLSNVRAVRTRFHYHDSVLLEAKRQKKLFGKFDDFGVKFSKLEKYDDVFSTFLQVPILIFFSGFNISSGNL